MKKTVRITESDLRKYVNEVLSEGGIGDFFRRMAGAGKDVAKATREIKPIMTNSKLFSRSAGRIASLLDAKPLTPMISSAFKNAEAEVFVLTKDIKRAASDVEFMKNPEMGRKLTMVSLTLDDLMRALPSKTGNRAMFSTTINITDVLDKRLADLLAVAPNNVNLKNAKQNLTDFIHAFDDALGSSISLK